MSNTEFPGQVDNAIVLTFEACRDPATGRLTDEIEGELKSLRSMTYVSPTGRGVCVVGTNDALGPLPPGKTTRWIDGNRVEIDVRSEPAAIPVPPEIVGSYEIPRTITDETRELLNFLADAPRNRTQSSSEEIGFEIVRFVKSGGPLTKRIGLSPEGKVNSDGSACVMWLGSALRTPLIDLRKFATLIDNLAANEAIGLGALRSGLPDEVEIVRKAKLAAMNGKTSNVIARTADAIGYVCNKPALALIDIDTKGMPIEVADRIKDAGGCWAALLRVLPGLESAARVVRPSTSAGLYRTDTGERFEGSGGFHIYLPIANGADCERFLGTFHNRCWLHGFGWHMVGRAGQLLERSLIDRTVCAGERLVFEANPYVVEPLKQDTSARAPVVTAGAILDTVLDCVPLTLVEQSKLDHLLAQSKLALAPESANARGAFVKEHAEKIAGRTGRTLADALRITRRWCEGTLTSTVVLLFDDDALAGCTVADVLADPDRFVGETLADPLEGVEYGRCKAKIMLRADGTPWIHSFAHGRTIYELKLDAASVDAALTKAPASEAAAAFVRLALAAELGADELEHLRDLASQRAGVGKRAIDRKLKAARQEQASQRAQEEHNRRAAERRDPRPQIEAPAADAPWLPQMQVLNDVLGACRAAEPPMRDIDGAFVQVRVRRIPNMHALTADGVNEGDAKESRLPAPEQPLLTRLNQDQLAELIEQHVDYADDTGRHVHLAAPFVRHYLERTDNALPVVAAIATLPVVLPDGTILAGHGLVRERGIVFRMPEQLVAMLPAGDECDHEAVQNALTFLIDTWLCDVAADYTGKCILIAAALTLIERSLLPDRPVFFVSAGRRGGGKTTTLIMLLMAVTGVRPSAAAWSPNEEERRKALLAYLMEALPAIIWDNIPRGTQISCPHIERSCTTAFYSDRRLGVSELVAVAAAVVHLFTGNNIGPRGDLASRALTARLEVERPDPENRLFTHPDPIGWTEAHRGRILCALYTILLGNPNLRSGRDAARKTRFKLWWHLVGSAIEHAVIVSGGSLDFQKLFLSQEEDEEESASLADALVALDEKWPNGKEFSAADLARMANDQSAYTSDADRQRDVTVREFLFPSTPHGQTVTAKAVGKRLKRHLGEPVKRGDHTLILKERRDPHGGPKGAISYFVQAS